MADFGENRKGWNEEAAEDFLLGNVEEVAIKRLHKEVDENDLSGDAIPTDQCPLHCHGL
jgi:hypothetical protein